MELLLEYLPQTLVVLGIACNCRGGGSRLCHLCVIFLGMSLVISGGLMYADVLEAHG